MNATTDCVGCHGTGSIFTRPGEEARCPACQGHGVRHVPQPAPPPRRTTAEIRAELAEAERLEAEEWARVLPTVSDVVLARECQRREWSITIRRGGA